jgi:taurine--2-oxoglutarate transaminase
VKTQDLPYFITWTAQNQAKTLPIEKVDQNFFYSGKNKWLNLSSISYQASFGLKNKRILDSIREQSQRFSMASPKHIFELKERVSQEIIKRTGSNYKCFYVQSGSEGIENAIKMVRQYSNRKIILAQHNSYHGATMGALALTGDWRNDNHLLPRQWTKRFPSPQEDPKGEKLNKLIEKVGPSKIAALCLETITGGNGVFIPPQTWFKNLSQTLKKHKILLILDEVVCAGHRTGPFFGYQNFKGVNPDFIVTAKAMTGGYFPLGVVLVGEKIAKFYNKNTLSCGLTNYAHPLGLAALKAVLDLTYEKSFHDHLFKVEREFDNFFNRLKQSGIKTRHIGMLGAIEVGDKVDLQDIFNIGLYCGLQNKRIILAPHLNIPQKVLSNGLKGLEELIHDRIN